MKKYKIFIIVVVAILAYQVRGFAQNNETFRNKIEPAKDSVSYPNVNTPNHNAVTPPIQGTFDDPKIIPDSSATKRDNRSRENPDSVRMWKQKKPDKLF